MREFTLQVHCERRFTLDLCFDAVRVHIYLGEGTKTWLYRGHIAASEEGNSDLDNGGGKGI